MMQKYTCIGFTKIRTVSKKFCIAGDIEIPIFISFSLPTLGKKARTDQNPCLEEKREDLVSHKSLFWNMMMEGKNGFSTYIWCVPDVELFDNNADIRPKNANGKQFQRVRKHSTR